MIANKVDWIVGLLVSERRTWFAASPYCVGRVEFVRTPDPEAAIQLAIRQSASAAKLQVKEDALWARTCIVEADESEAWAWGRGLVEEALSALLLNTMGLNGDLMPVGYAFEIRSGRCVPLVPRAQSWSPLGMFAELDTSIHHPLHVLRHMVAINADRRPELWQALLRSLHWRRMARDLAGVDRFLFEWMAIEAITKIDENDTIDPKVAASLGFIHSKLILFSELERRELSRPDVAAWRERVLSWIHGARDLRNEIVHRGFRQLDVLHATAQQGSDIERQFQITSLAVPRLQLIAANAAILGTTTVADLWWRGFPAAIRVSWNSRPPTADALERVIPALTAPVNAQEAR